MSILITIACQAAVVAAVGLLWWGVSELIFRRNQRRKNIRFHNTLDRIMNSKDLDEIIAIRDAYRDELGNPLNL